MNDYCCASSNAVEAEEAIFVPDRNLAAYVAERVEGKRIMP